MFDFSETGAIEVESVAVVKRFAVVIACILAMAGTAGAELWCGSGPGAPLDHPCVDDTSRFDRAFADHGLEMAEWRKIPGVESIGYGISHRGFFPEIQIWVKDTTKIPSVRAKIPASIDGIAIAVVPPLKATTGGPTDTTVKCPDQGQAYIQAMKENMQAWQRIPGVVGAGPSKCDSKCCYFDRIGVAVQVPFLDSARAKIPTEVHGIPVDVVAYRWPPRE
jgi:hypothetical protein